MRLDQALVARGLLPTRARARDVILRGEVKVAGQLARKPGKMVGAGDIIELSEGAGRYVSRSALKLAAALDEFSLAVAGQICLDIGASTGGFTQLLLERLAAKVYAVDVGRNQLHDSLRANPRVVSMEQTDARALCRDLIPEPITAIVADVSFISLTQVLGAALPLAADQAWLVALIKPQFEVGRDGLGKGGIVRDVAAREAAVIKVQDWLGAQAGWQIIGTLPSPISGGAGNLEFLVGAEFDSRMAEG